ncbi:HAD-IIIC family phosphatase [Streptosporangium sp. CA-135522]|uniref:HAD-IIIC family phosphatase n=1 Tax=Streptosporangium sp. CA-135522 TaxID=3240072 RepID=UPI003D8E5C91
MSDLLEALHAAVEAGRVPGSAVRAELAACRDPQLVRRAGRLLSRLPAGEDHVRVRVLATCSIGAFQPMLYGVLAGAGVNPLVECGQYGAFELEMGTANLQADMVICLLDDSYFLPADWHPADLDGLGEHLEGRLADLRGLLEAAAARSAATFVLHTVPLPAVVSDTVIGLRGRARLQRHWYRLNAGLLDLAGEHGQVAVTDLAGELAETPVAARDDRLHHFGDLPYTDGALLVLARQVRRVVQATLGLSRKVLALDLDNTLWGGVVGEVGGPGLELGGLYPGKSYTALQHTARRLREQGVLLVLASKNDADLVEEVIATHPEMVLRGEEFSVLAVNWAGKPDNLRETASTLDLSPDSFVFMDDSPAERAAVRVELPGVAIVAADGDPAHLARRLVEPGWFDVVEVTESDLRRPEMYRSRALRQDFAGTFGSAADYLRALSIRLSPQTVTPYTVARVAQLAARTNQFNLAGQRFDEARTTAMIEDPGHLVVAFSVSDRFGDEGVVGAAWLDRSGRDGGSASRWCVLDLVLSCRVLGRGVERAIAGWLAATARQAGATRLIGRYAPSERNGVAAGFWTSAGFAPTRDAELFELDLTGYSDPTPEWVAVEERTPHA